MLNSGRKNPIHELMQLDQFVNYVLEPKGDRVTKPPVDANGYKINPQDPANWRSFEEVMAVKC
jgi:primase-polymerase (primpol)-like protein